MWGFFQREAFPYQIGEREPVSGDFSVFILHKAVRKTTGETVSVFTYNVKGGSRSGLEYARTAVKKLKTIKHPCILTYIDSFEDENVIHLVTEPVVPLLTYLKHTLHDESADIYLKWGLKSISEAVAFLHENNLRHNNIFHGAVFVDNSGSWKLGELGLSSGHENAPPPVKVVEDLNKYNCPHLKSAPRCADFWGLGVLVWEVFNGQLGSSEKLSVPKKIPSELVANFLGLINKNVNIQESIPRLIESCSQNNLLISTLDNLHNYHLKDKDVKSKVCKDLLTLIQKIPKDLVLHKILKLLKQAYEFDADNSAFLVPVVAKIPSIVTEEEFHDNVEQFIITLFSSNDRATRLALLMSIEEIVNKINKKSINEIFPYVHGGFLDTNPKIRGETVKAIVHFAPKLSKKHLNDDAFRYLIQIQTKDPEEFMRTNSTICLGKIAHCFQPDVRKKQLLSAFLHALRDPSPAVRNAGTQAIAVNNQFFPLESIAKNILPGLVSLTVDVNTSVRKNAFKVIKMLLIKLERISDSPELKDELEKDVLSQTCDSSSSVFAIGWAFSAITSKFLKPTDVKTKPVDVEPHENDRIISSQRKYSLEENSNEKAFTEKSSIDKTFTEVAETKKVEIPYDVEDDDDDKSDWENDGWGEAKEEVLKPSTSKPQDNLPKKKNVAGPMKLGIRLNK